MKYLFFLLFALPAFCFTLNLNSGKDDGNDYFIVHLEDSKNINCQIKYQKSQKIYLCYVNSRLQSQPEDQNLPFMQLYFRAIDDEKFAVVIAPKLKSALLNLDAQLFNDKAVILEDSNLSKHYAILIDEKIAKFEPKKGGLNFPIIFGDLMRPRIGALDFNKEPLTFEKNGDIGIYLEIKRNYDHKVYQEAMKGAENAIKTQSESVFANEFWLYYIKSLDKMADAANDYKEAGNYESKLIDTAKVWMKNFASDKNYPEVLYLLMKAYLSLDQDSDTSYTLDILMTEHPNSPWTQKAILLYAGALFDKGQSEDAIRLYCDVLYSAKNKDVASEAALKLAFVSFKSDKASDGANYVRKILNANSGYLADNKTDAINLATNLNEFGYPNLAGEIYKLILDNSVPKQDEYEIALRHLALLDVDKNDAQKTYAYQLRYQKEFKNSEYLPLITAAADKLFFDLDMNSSLNLHENYADLMKKYGSNEIGKRALLEDIKLYNKEKNYAQILALENKIDDNESEANSYVNSAALNLAEAANQKGECDKVVNLIEKYNIESKISDKYKLYSCYMRTAKFEKALNLATPLIQTLDLHDKVEWLSNTSKALFSLGRYQECVRACDDALAIAVKAPYADPTESIFYRFYSLLFLDKFNEAISSIKALEDLRGTDNKLAEAYNATAKYAAAHGFESVALNYAKKTIEMQNRLKISTFSPEIEFVYIDSLNKISKFEDSMNVCKKLLKTKLNSDQRARALYNATELYIKKGDDYNAKKLNDECLNLSEKSPWKDLCAEQNKLLQTSHF